MIALLYHYKAIAHAAGKPVASVTPYVELADVIHEVVTETGKPVVLVLPNPKRGLADMDIVEMLEKARQTFLERGIPVFDEIGDALWAISHVNAYHRGREATHR